MWDMSAWSVMESGFGMVSGNAARAAREPVVK